MIARRFGCASALFLFAVLISPGVNAAITAIGQALALGVVLLAGACALVLVLAFGRGGQQPRQEIVVQQVFIMQAPEQRALAVPRDFEYWAPIDAEYREVA